jgi:C4-dicarboxylate transporter DctM subunit|tara:strand:- start:446 stop:880 length:435 start_codon:yes stop_codon:yes gene_type:complete
MFCIARHHGFAAPTAIPHDRPDADAGGHTVLYLAGFAVIYLILGMLIDPIAIMVMTLPVMFPIMTGVGYDPIWLGVISIKLAEISLITPPVGLNVYVVRSASPVPLTLEDVFAGIMPFLLLDLVTLALLIAFPQIVTFLPTLMM